MPTAMIAKPAAGASGSMGPVDAEQVLLGCLQPVRRWARQRLPPAARGACDTMDLVQEAAVRVWPRLQRLPDMPPAAMQAYLRKAVLNLVRDSARDLARRPLQVELGEHDVASARPTASERLTSTCVRRECRTALLTLSRRDRRLLLARYIAGYRMARIAQQFEFASADAARMAVNRATARFQQRLIAMK